MNRRWAWGAVAVGVVAAAVAWPRLRDARVRAYQTTLLQADAATDAVGVPLGGRFYRSGELQIAAADTLLGPDKARRSDVEPPFDDPVSAIVDFRDRLAERGVELWVLPSPVRPWVAPGQVDPAARMVPPSVYEAPYRGFVDALKDEGVVTIDLLPALRARAFVQPSQWIHRSDPHWTGNGVVLAARTIAGMLRGRGWVDGPRRIDTQATWVEETREASAGGIDLPDEPDETIEVRRVRLAGRKGRAARVDVGDRSASVVILGDSHVNWYHAFEADLGRQLVHETGQPVDTLPLVGGGATRAREELVRRSWTDPDYLASKRVAIWVFWMEDVWSRSWGIVPLDPVPEPKRVRRTGEARASVDRHLLIDGQGEASFGYRWTPPEAGDERATVAWIRKPEAGRLAFHGPVPDGASLIAEVVGRKADRSVSWTLDGKPLPSFVAEQGTTRVRVPLPKRGDGEHNLRIGIEDEPRPPNVLGLRNLTLVTTRTVWAADLDPGDGERFDAPHQERDRRFATTPGRFVVPLALDEDPGAAVVRARLRSIRGRHPLTVEANGRVVVKGRTVDRSWTEHAIEVPEGVLRAGDNELVFTVPGGPRSLAWDVLEVDRVGR